MVDQYCAIQHHIIGGQWQLLLPSTLSLSHSLYIYTFSRSYVCTKSIKTYTESHKKCEWIRLMEAIIIAL